MQTYWGFTPGIYMCHVWSQPMLTALSTCLNAATHWGTQRHRDHIQRLSGYGYILLLACTLRDWQRNWSSAEEGVHIHTVSIILSVTRCKTGEYIWISTCLHRYIVMAWNILDDGTFLERLQEWTQFIMFWPVISLCLISDWNSFCEQETPTQESCSAVTAREFTRSKRFQKGKVDRGMGVIQLETVRYPMSVFFSFSFFFPPFFIWQQFRKLQLSINPSVHLFLCRE